MEPPPDNLALMELRLTLWPGGEDRRLATRAPAWRVGGVGGAIASPPLQRGRTRGICLGVRAPLTARHAAELA